MALSNAERQKKWREKNGARINFERRQKRKNLPVPVLAESTGFDSNIGTKGGEARESTNVEVGVARRDVQGSCGGQTNLSGGVESGHAVGSRNERSEQSQRTSKEKSGQDTSPIVEGQDSGSSAPPAQTFKDEVLEKLCGLIKVEEEKPRVEVPVRLPVRRSETGMIISEEQYQAREECKRRSREKGFVLDEYSQA